MASFKDRLRDYINVKNTQFHSVDDLVRVFPEKPRATISKTAQSLAKANLISRVARGVYSRGRSPNTSPEKSLLDLERMRMKKEEAEELKRQIARARESSKAVLNVRLRGVSPTKRKRIRKEESEYLKRQIEEIRESSWAHQEERLRSLKASVESGWGEIMVAPGSRVRGLPGPIRVARIPPNPMGFIQRQSLRRRSRRRSWTRKFSLEFEHPCNSVRTRCSRFCRKRGWCIHCFDRNACTGV